jgi:hypothetical protein
MIKCKKGVYTEYLTLPAEDWRIFARYPGYQEKEEYPE